MEVGRRLREDTFMTSGVRRALVPPINVNKVPIFRHTSQPAMMGLEQRQAVGDILHHGLPVTGRQISHTPSMPQPDLFGINSGSPVRSLGLGCAHSGTGQQFKQKSSACTRLRSVRRPCRLRPRQQSTVRQGLSVSRRWTSVAAHRRLPSQNTLKATFFRAADVPSVGSQSAKDSTLPGGKPL